MQISRIFCINFNDAGQPHVHFVTTSIKADGRRRELHNLGKIQSKKARKEFEQTLGRITLNTVRKARSNF